MDKPKTITATRIVDGHLEAYNVAEHRWFTVGRWAPPTSKYVNEEMFFVVETAEQRKEAADFVAHLRSHPVMSVFVKVHKKQRSVAQNRLMWMWYKVIAEHCGCTPTDLHEQMKVRLLGVEKKVILGQAIIMPKSSTELDVEQMTAFLEGIEALAVDLKIVLPQPAETNYAMGRR